MKKIYLYPIALTLAFGLYSCNNSPNKLSTKVTQDTTAVEELPFGIETVTIEKEGPQDMNVHYKYTVDYPSQGPEDLVQLVRKHIFQGLGDSTLTNDFSKEDLDRIGQQFVDKSVAEIKAYQEEEDAREIGYGDEGSFKVVENNDRILTYHLEGYLYTGGAHGMPINQYLTFDKSQCKVLTWDDLFLTEKLDSLGQLIREELNVQYYKEYPRDWKDEVFPFKLPKQTPVLTSEGVMFNYEAYEVDCYAAGMPHCTLPYSRISSWMTAAAKALIP